MSGKLLWIGDFNGDGRDDMMCHAPWNGHKWISLTNPDGSFPHFSWYAHVQAKILNRSFYQNVQLCHNSIFQDRVPQKLLEGNLGILLIAEPL